MATKFSACPYCSKALEASELETGYECDSCGQSYSTEEEADACCADLCAEEEEDAED